MVRCLAPATWPAIKVNDEYGNLTARSWRFCRLEKRNNAPTETQSVIVFSEGFA
jgi:hypothetical protein